MKRSNWDWGELTISNELKAMGINVCKKTVTKILRDNGLLPPRTRFTPPTWSATYNAVSRRLAMDFPYIFDSYGRQLFVMNIIDCSTRKLLVCNPTYSPTREWIIQQIRNAMHDYASLDIKMLMIHDNDALFSGWLPAILEEFGLVSKPIDPGCRWQNGRVERFNRTLKTQLLNRIPVIDEQHARELCFLYQTYYNESRNHQALHGGTPDAPTRIPKPAPKNFSYEKKLVLNSLITSFKIAA